MARGDVTVIMYADMAQDETNDRQPGSGVEEMIIHIAMQGERYATGYSQPALSVRQRDGTNNEAQVLPGNGGQCATVFFNFRMVASNTQYWEFTNAGPVDDATVGIIVVGA